MSLVKNKNKKTGITYVYESESYWDKEKQQPRAHRKLIGKIDEATGEIVPTGGRGKGRGNSKAGCKNAAVQQADTENLLKEKDLEIERLSREIGELRKEKERIINQFKSILESISD